MEFSQFEAIIRRRIFIFFFSAALFIVVACVAIMMQPRQYQAGAKIIITQERNYSGSLQAAELPKTAEAIRSDSVRNIQTQIEVVRSRPVAAQALAMTGYRADDVSYGVTDKQDSDIIIVTAVSQNPRKAVKFANAVAEAYIKFLGSTRRESTKEARRFLQAQKERAKRQLDEAEERRKNFKQQSGIVELDQEQAAMVRTLVEFQSNLENSKVEQRATQSRVSAVSRQLTREEAKVIVNVVFSENPLMVNLRGRISDMETELAGVRQKYGDRHPKVTTLQASIQQMKEKMKGEADNIISSRTEAINPQRQDLMSELVRQQVNELALNSRVGAVKSAIAQMQKQMDSFPEDEARLAGLTREALLKERLYNNLEQQHQDFSISERTKIVPASIVEPAEQASEATTTRRPILFGIAVVAGLILGAVTALMIHYFDDAIYSADDVKRHLNTFVLARVPFEKSLEQSPLMALKFPNSPVTEIFRSLRNKMKYIMPELRGKTILVTSSVVEEGKSTVAGNLAIVMAQYDLKVLLIDSDLRHPTIHRYFNIRNEGITNLLIDELPLKDLIQETEVPNLHILTSGPFLLLETSPFNSSELIESKKFKALFESLKSQYDFIVVDAPPVLVVTDVLSLAQSVDGIILVVDAGFVRRADAVEARHELEMVSAPILGVVLNKVTTAAGAYYYKYYYYYGKDTGKGKRKHAKRA